MKKYIYSLVGDFYHDHDLILASLREAEKLFGDEAEVIDFEVKDLGEVIKKKPALIIMNKENRLNPQDEVINHWLTDELDKALEDYVMQGGSFIAWHAALASYDENSKYINMLKGSFKYHPAENKPVRFISNSNLPFEDKSAFDFEVMDEHYFVNCSEENTNVFLSSESVDGKSIAGWNHEYGKGRICCITPTHRREGLLNADMVRLLNNCINWCIK